SAATRKSWAGGFTCSTCCRLKSPPSSCSSPSSARSCWRRARRTVGTKLMIPTSHYLILSTLVLTIGVIGVLTRRNVLIVLMSIELIFNAVNINLVAFSKQLNNTIGQVFVVFVITVAAAEAAVGLGIVIALFRNKEKVNLDEIDLLKW